MPSGGSERNQPETLGSNLHFQVTVLQDVRSVENEQIQSQEDQLLCPHQLPLN